MMRVPLALALLLLSPAAVVAGVGAGVMDAGAWDDGAVHPCGPGIGADQIARLGPQHTASYAQGDLRVGMVRDVSAGGAGLRLLILGPLRDTQHRPQCRTVGAAGKAGFSAIDFAGRSASYDPATGLTLGFAVEDPALGAGDEGQYLLGVRIHLGNGQILTQGMK